MNETLEQIVKILKELAVNIDSGKFSYVETSKKLAGLAVALENYLNEGDKMVHEKIISIEEKLSFLIFMQAKNVKMGSPNGPDAMISGEALFKQWREAKIKAKNHAANLKPLPSEEEGGDAAPV